MIYLRKIFCVGVFFKFEVDVLGFKIYLFTCCIIHGTSLVPVSCIMYGNKIIYQLQQQQYLDYGMLCLMNAQ